MNNLLTWTLIQDGLAARRGILVSNSAKAPEYRRQAEICFEMAKQMSLIEDRDRLLKMAEQWLGLARNAEAENH